jgi:hypothetical protein
MNTLLPDPDDSTLWVIGDSTDPVLGAHQGHAVLENVHPAVACQGRNCVVHNPSVHFMREWNLVWRGDKGVMERTCPHGVGHPDPDDAAFLKQSGRGYLTVHGCDGCCTEKSVQ